MCNQQDKTVGEFRADIGEESVFAPFPLYSGARRTLDRLERYSQSNLLDMPGAILSILLSTLPTTEYIEKWLEWEGWHELFIN